jgi:hypothetical protein
VIPTPITLRTAVSIYFWYLTTRRKASYSVRQNLHTHLEAHYGQLEHCRMVREINGEFDRLEREAGVSQVGWHGTKS